MRHTGTIIAVLSTAAIIGTTAASAWPVATKKWLVRPTWPTSWQRDAMRQASTSSGAGATTTSLVSGAADSLATSSAFVPLTLRPRRRHAAFRSITFMACHTSLLLLRRAVARRRRGRRDLGLVNTAIGPSTFTRATGSGPTH